MIWCWRHAFKFYTSYNIHHCPPHILKFELKPLKLKTSNSTINVSVFFSSLVILFYSKRKQSKAFIISVHSFNMQINGKHFHHMAIANIAWTKQIIIRSCWIWRSDEREMACIAHTRHTNTRLYFHWFYSLCGLVCVYRFSWMEKGKNPRIPTKAIRRPYKCCILALSFTAVVFFCIFLRYTLQNVSNVQNIVRKSDSPVAFPFVIMTKC